MVVGGGIVGLATAVFLAERNFPVTLVESGAEFGGLLRSTYDSEGNHYDFGTHIPCLTGDDTIDETLFGNKTERLTNWHSLHKINPISWNKGKWNRGGSLLDARVLAKADYKLGLNELLCRTTEVSKETDLKTFLHKTIGPTFTEKLVQPVLQKIFFTDASRLVPDSSVIFFGLNRVTVLDREKTNHLMKDPVFASKLAFHTLDDYYKWDNNKQIDSYLYPRAGRGCGYWAQYLERKAEVLNVQLLSNTRVDSMKLRYGRVSKIKLSSEDFARSPEHIFWSAPPVMANHAMGCKAVVPKPSLLTTTLYHLSYNRGLLLKNVEYFWNWDIKYKIFRVTLYPNIDTDSSAPRLTAEVLSHKESKIIPSLNEINQELIEMGVVASSAKITWSQSHTLRNTFPVPNESLQLSMKFQNEKLATIPNLSLVGRYGVRKWLLNDVLVDAYRKVNAICTTN